MLSFGLIKLTIKYFFINDHKTIDHDHKNNQ
jgi:hypothetical protein